MKIVIIIALPLSIFYNIKMLILSFGERYNSNSNRSNNERSETSIANPEFNIIVNLHPTDGTNWVLVIGREGESVYYFDGFSVGTPALFLEEYVDLGSNERTQEYDESYCCGLLFMYGRSY